jgi:hypothetical protein
MPQAPFSYSNSPDNVTTFSMTPGNSAPALVVWLFMLTAREFLKNLETAAAGDITKLKFIDTGHNTIDLAGISNITNLAPQAIIDLFDMYLLPNATDSVRQSTQQAFGQVVDPFQAFASKHKALWDEDDCPAIAGLKQLAASGAIVDPIADLSRKKKAAKQALPRAARKAAKKVVKKAAKKTVKKAVKKGKR